MIEPQKPIKEGSRVLVCGIGPGTLAKVDQAGLCSIQMGAQRRNHVSPFFLFDLTELQDRPDCAFSRSRGFA